MYLSYRDVQILRTPNNVQAYRVNNVPDLKSIEDINKYLVD